MNSSLSPNTQAILLLTAPLIAGRGESSADLLTPGEYKRLARLLHSKRRQPADFLVSDAQELLEDCNALIDSDRIKRLLARGFLLSQAVEHWRTRAIWVVSRADAEYPRRLKSRLKDDAPPVLYGCGDAAILETGGLAVVGSRDVDQILVEYTERIGQLTAKSKNTLVSGGARGIDQAAMRGALGAGGTVAGVLADSFERAVLNREHRNLLLEGQLVLVTPYDPAASFNVGHAMQRNKLIYALADAALVVSSDYQKGGTWTGAVEQLEKLRFVPLYVRLNGGAGKGLEALRIKGALPWPNPDNPEEFAEALAIQTDEQRYVADQAQLFLSLAKEEAKVYEVEPPRLMLDTETSSDALNDPATNLFAVVRSLLEMMDTPKTEAEIAAALDVSKAQTKLWLQRLVSEGVMERLSKPTRYRASASKRLF